MSVMRTVASQAHQWTRKALPTSGRWSCLAPKTSTKRSRAIRERSEGSSPIPCPITSTAEDRSLNLCRVCLVGCGNGNALGR